MKLRHKILAVVAALIVALGFGISPASAVYGNSVHNSGTKTLSIQYESTGSIVSINPGQRAWSVRNIVVKPGTCIRLWYSLPQVPIRKCNPGRTNLYQPVASGNWNALRE